MTNFPVEWTDAVRQLYGSVDFEAPLESRPKNYPDESSPLEWTEQRFRHIIDLKEDALYKARQTEVDYVLFLDCDQFLMHPKTIQHLMWSEKVIVTPVLRALESNYSNFWAGITPEGYYQRTDEYIPILYREQLGVFDVPMVHSTVLVDMRLKASKLLTFNPDNLHGYDGPIDDLLVFAESARVAGIEMHVTNMETFGWLLEPPSEEGTLQLDVEGMRYFLLGMFSQTMGILTKQESGDELEDLPRTKMGFDEVYLINLNRRSERRLRMEACFRLLGMDAVHWPASDGTLLNDDKLVEMGIKMLPEFADPYHKRPLTKGEIGCFLSHYRIWNDMVERNLGKVLVFEDDLRFIKFFRPLLDAILEDAEFTNLDWDLIYLGRKRLNPSRDGAEPVPGSRIRSLNGAKKLLAGKPLEKLVPVDEYLPIMFDSHPEVSWMNHFPKRDLKAFTAEPLLVHPTHYTGDHGYISDTENATVIDEQLQGSEPSTLEAKRRGAFEELESIKDEL